MATPIKQAIFIGLGGTGMSSVLTTKKLFYDTYGEIPPMVAFLGIDTDGGAYDKYLTARDGKEIRLLPSEQLAIQVQDARAIYNQNRDSLGWVPDVNVPTLTAMTRGAGQIRTNGRFAVAANTTAVMRKIEQLELDVTRASIRDNARYYKLDGEPEIHMAFSVCGGTGCGTFLDVAFLIRKQIPDVKLVGYALLPGVFNAMASGAAMANVDYNAYGALLDLDFLMNRRWNAEGVKNLDIKYIRECDTMSIDQRPFTSFYFIDNRNEQGDSYSQIDDLADMVALSWITAAGELGTASASVADNTDKVIQTGSMDMDDKKPWVSALGVSEIIYRGEDLADIYALKAAKLLINKLCSTTADADQIADTWIDNIRIRENNNNDQVIDALLSPDVTALDLDKDECKEPESAVSSWLQMNKPDQTQLDQNAAQLKNKVEESLYAKVKELINSDGGVALTEQFLASVEKSIDVFVGEMTQEAKEAHELQPGLDANLDTAAKELAECADTIFKRGLTDKKDTFLDALTTATANRRQEARRNTAITFYNWLKTEPVARLKAHAAGVRQLLAAAGDTISAKLAQTINSAGRNNHIFQIDLSASQATKIEVNAQEVILSELLGTLGGEKIYDFAVRRKEEIAAAITDYTSTLGGAKQLRSRTLGDIFDAMSDDDFEAMTKKAILKASPMLRIDKCGHMTGEPMKHYYVGVFDKDNNRLAKGDYFKSKVGASDNVSVTNIGNPNHAIIYHQDSVYTALCVQDLFGRARGKYLSATNPEKYHFNADIYTQMGREEYSIEPKKAIDNSVELWAMGFIFGFLKNEVGAFYIKDENDDDAVFDDYWVKLADYRDDAFAAFKNGIKTKKWDELLEGKIEAECSSKGSEAIKALADDAAAGTNYLTRYAQLGFEPSHLKDHGNEAVAALVKNETNWVKKELAKRLL